MTRKPVGQKGFLSRLLRNQAGNVLAMTAAMLIPLMGLVGGGVDMSRLYLTKTRLQQACDAGALAGRKAMGNGSWTTTSSGTQSRANSMFDANFKTGDYGTGTSTRTFTEANGTVTGTASVVVPMMIVKVLGFASKTVNVSCTARMEIPNTDVMFVLDVTGSMAQKAISTDTNTKIEGLRSAVKCFYEALTQVNTSEVCGNDPTGTTYSGTAQIRMGFVPYSVNVNVGKLLPNSFLADDWSYQTRKGVYYTPSAPTVNSYDETASFSKSSSCTTWATGSDATGFPSDSSTPNSFTVTTITYTKTGYNSKTKICKRRVDQSTVDYARDDTNGTYFHTWIYNLQSINVSGLKAGGSSWNNSISHKVGDDGTDQTVDWNGCIEERQTIKNSDYDPSNEWSPIPSSAYDMDIDLMPSSTPGTMWGPMLGGVVFERYSSSSNWGSSSYRTTSAVTTSYNGSPEDEMCPAEARKLQSWTTASPFESYVDSLSPVGNTYHDIGMIWGARFISPTGIFASENATTPSGQPIQRHIVFMTDGDTQTSNTNYSAYGIHWWDRRQTTYAPSNTDLDNIVNARLTALCTAIRNKNITLWVISFGSGVTSAAQTRLQNCASTPNGIGAANTHFFNASDTSALQAAFKQIAAQIANLRLTS